MDKPPIEITALQCAGMDSATITVRGDNGELLQEVIAVPDTDTLQLHPDVKTLPQS